MRPGADPHQWMLWILGEDGKPRLADFLEWTQWVQTADRQIAHTTLPSGAMVSTVFLAVPPDPFLEVPLLFETMVLHQTADGAGTRTAHFCQRYATRELAEQGHSEVVDACTKGQI